MQQSTIDKYSHLLNPTVPNPTEADYWAAVAKYTNACCWDEQATYRLIAKDGPDACSHPAGRGVNCDKVCNLHSGGVYDLVVNGGTPQQHPGFTSTGDKVSPDQMVMPYQPDFATAPPTTAPGYPPYPGDQSFDVIGDALFSDYAEAKVAPNQGMSRWFGRCDYDYLTGIVADSTAAMNKHRPDWRKELGLPPKQSSQG